MEVDATRRSTSWPSTCRRFRAKRYFAIGEVSELCDVKPHVLRYWEQEFPQLQARSSAAATAATTSRTTS